jgi:hypothetical protein
MYHITIKGLMGGGPFLLFIFLTIFAIACYLVVSNIIILDNTRRSSEKFFAESLYGIYLGSSYTSSKDHGYRLSDLKLEKVQRDGADFVVFTLKVDGNKDVLPNVLAVATTKAYNDDTEAYLEVKNGADWGRKMSGKSASNTNKVSTITTNYFVWRGIRLQKDNAIRISIREKDIANALGKGNKFVYALATSTTGAFFAEEMNHNQNCAGYFELQKEDCPIGCGQYEGQYTRVRPFKVTQEAVGTGRPCPEPKIIKCPATPPCAPTSANVDCKGY